MDQGACKAGRLKAIGYIMKYNVVKIVLNIILIAGISYCSANATGISEEKYPRKTPVKS